MVSNAAARSKRSGPLPAAATGLALVVGLALMVGLAACGSNQGPTGTKASSTTATSAESFTIRGYVIPPLTAAAGQKITIADGDAEPHTVTADDGSFDTGSFDQGSPGTLVAPRRPGIYKVHCSVHPSMHGTLTVH